MPDHRPGGRSISPGHHQCASRHGDLPGCHPEESKRWKPDGLFHRDAHLSPHDTDGSPDSLRSQHLDGPHPGAHVIYPGSTITDTGDALRTRTCGIAGDIRKTGMGMDQSPGVMDDTGNKDKCRRQRDDQRRDRPTRIICTSTHRSPPLTPQSRSGGPAARRTGHDG